jgi:yersiniabactin nonribosomal peptide synthetase
METNTDIREYSIAVVAMQGRFPDAENISQFWENLREGRDSIKPVDMDEIRKNMPEDVYSKENFVPYASYIDGSTLFDNSFFEVSDREAVLMDPQHRIFLELCNHAMEEMGYVSGKTDRIMGVFAGNAFNTYLT